MTKLIIEEIDIYRYGDERGTWTYDRPDSGFRITHGKAITYFTPYGIDWECDGGHGINQYTQAEFDKRYSLVMLR
jgi:hypothetical protein